MPNRILRDGILTSDRVNTLAWDVEVFYRRLMSVVDDYGRYSANARLLRAACYPLHLDKVSDSDVEKWLLATEKAALVRVYPTQDGKRYLEVIDFRQQVRAKASKCPPPPDVCIANAAQTNGTRIASAHSDGDGDGDGDGDDKERKSAGAGDAAYSWAEKIVTAYVRRDSPMECIQAVASAIEAGEMPDGILQAVVKISALCAKAPGGAGNQYVPKAKTFFTEGQWRSPEAFEGRWTVANGKPATRPAYTETLKEL